MAQKPWETALNASAILMRCALESAIMINGSTGTPRLSESAFKFWGYATSLSRRATSWWYVTCIKAHCRAFLRQDFIASTFDCSLTFAMLFNVALLTGLFLTSEVLAVPSGQGASLARRRNAHRYTRPYVYASDTTEYTSNWAGAVWTESAVCRFSWIHKGT